MRTSTTAKPELTRSFTPVRSPLLQRKCACGNSAGLTGTCGECQKKNLTLQRRATNQNEVSQVPPLVHEVLRSPGQPLDRDTRTFMESRFSHDFSEVRVHTDDRAAKSSQAVNALAYTVGKDVVFASGQYTPNTTAGKKVLAHELTHVLQQNSMSSPTAIATLKVGSSNDFYEREAEVQAEKVVSTNEAIATPIQRHTSAIQRLGDFSKVPAGLSCPIATSTPPPATNSMLFPNREVALSPLQKAQIENFVSNWRATGASTPVRVDGFASQVGTDELNWQLSCDRAQAVVAELRSPSSGTVSGIPASFITVFAQGETTEFGTDEQNRRVTIQTPIPAPPTPPASSCKVDVRATHIGGILSGVPVWHLFVIFTDATGVEFFFRGGPGGSCPGVSTSSHGTIISTRGRYVPGTVDWDTAAPSTTALTGATACGKDTCFASELARIDTTCTPYNPLGPNSNTVAKTILSKCGVPLVKPVAIAPGWGDPVL